MARLLSPNPQRIPKPVYDDSSPDAVAARFAGGTDATLVDKLAAIVGKGNYAHFVSANRTCEMGLQMVADKPFESIAVLVERASRPEVTLA